MFRLALLLLCSLVLPASAAQAEAPPSYTLSELEALARQNSDAMLAVRDQVDAVRAGVKTARAFPNPEIEYLHGPSQARAGTPATGDTHTSSVSQPIDLPHRRRARIDTAEAALEAAEANGRSQEAGLIAQLQLRYYDLLRKQAELKASQEDATLIDAIRNRIAQRVAVGESPRFELIKAETEALSARKSVQAASIRVQQAHAVIRQLVGRTLPASFTVSGRLEAIQEPPTLDAVRAGILLHNPEVRRAHAELRQAEAQLKYAQSLRWPELALKASRDEDPELRTNRVGLVMTLPLWDWKDGPQAEARANLARARHQLAQIEFALEQEIDLAYQHLEIARTQVTALESGIIRQAEAALKVAEAAYRFGERGFIDVLDAQRVFRAARNELIAARYEFAAACSDIERLQAQPGNTP